MMMALRMSIKSYNDLPCSANSRLELSLSLTGKKELHNRRKREKICRAYSAHTHKWQRIKETCHRRNVSTESK